MTEADGMLTEEDNLLDAWWGGGLDWNSDVAAKYVKRLVDVR